MNSDLLAKRLLHFAQTYTYLVSSILLFLLFCLLYLLNARQRGSMVLSGLFSIPFAFSSIMFVPEYWNPVRIGTIWAGPEDILFSFSTGGIAWVVATWFFRHRIILRIERPRFLRRYLTVCFSGAILGTILNYLGMPIMNATLTSICIHGLVLLTLCREYLLIVATGALVFTFCYTLFGMAILIFFPDFVNQWNLKQLSGLCFYNVPVEEIYWAFAFGAVWPLLMAYAFDVQLKGGHHFAETASPATASARPEENIPYR